MNEEEIEQLARENFSRRIRAIAMESLLLEKTKVEKKTKKEGKEDDDWKSLRKNADDDDDDDFKDDEKTNNAFINARKEMARGLGISARAFQSAAEMLSQEDRAVNAAPSQKEEETKNVEENDAPEVDDDERRKRMAMMEERSLNLSPLRNLVPVACPRVPAGPQALPHLYVEAKAGRPDINSF